MRGLSRSNARTRLAPLLRHVIVELERLAAGFRHGAGGAARSGYARPRLNTPCIAISTTSFGFCGKDAELHRIIADIREEERSHLHHAEARIADVKTDRHVLRTFIAVATEGVFWLSTWGDSIRMARDLRA